MEMARTIMNRVNAIRRKLWVMISAVSPIYIFHHIPKCGGSSIRMILNEWFVVKSDYRNGRTFQFPEESELEILTISALPSRSLGA